MEVLMMLYSGTSSGDGNPYTRVLIPKHSTGLLQYTIDEAFAAMKLSKSGTHSIF
jgi:hypothetical protein